MIELNLPAYDYRLRKQSDKPYIYDDLRRKFVRLTPEEWVRQHFVHYLIEHLGYPTALMQNEVALQLGQTTQRCDTVLYDRQLQPRMILEYKAPTVALTSHVLEQISRYNLVLRVPYLILSNGIEHRVYHLDYEAQSYQTLGLIPAYSEL